MAAWKTRAAEQGNRVRIPNGNRRCMRDVRCSSTKVRHWGRALRRQSRLAKVGKPAPSVSQKTYKKGFARCGTLHLHLLHRKTAVDLRIRSRFFMGGDRNDRKKQQKSTAGAEKNGARHDRGRPQTLRRKRPIVTRWTLSEARSFTHLFLTTNCWSFCEKAPNTWGVLLLSGKCIGFCGPISKPDSKIGRAHCVRQG